MALFGSKKNKEVKEERKDLSSRTPSSLASDATLLAPVALRKVSQKAPSLPLLPILHRGQHHDIIIRPRITEKSGLMSENASIYTFEVRRNATKPSIALAIKTLYKVTPRKVRIVNLPAKRVIVRGKRGVSSGVKKALVYLKKRGKDRPVIPF